MIDPQLETVSVDSLHHDPANVREHDQRNLDAIKASLTKFGQQKPIVVGTNNVVIAGNGQLTAAKALGWKTISIQRSSLVGAEAIAFAIADNRTAELASWNDSDLAQQLAALQIDDEALAACTGFTEAEIEALTLNTKEIDEDEVPPLPVVPITKTGDLWLMGDHRLLCGDSTKADDVARLMDGEKADLCFTSPPYSDQRTYNSADVSLEKLIKFLPLAIECSVMQCVNLGISRKKNRIVRYWDQYIDTAEASGSLFLSWNVWSRHGFGGSVGNMTAMFPIEHEWILVFGKERKEINKTVPNKHGGKLASRTNRAANGIMSESRDCEINLNGKLGSVFVSDFERGNNKHPAMFPVKFPAAYIQACSNISVYDPFLGSGTTLIAAEQLGRKCYGMEISPQYCDVIVKRWENLTGKTATLA